MTFLNPLVLLGLAAAAIPIIIHLLNLRKLRTIEFSSLRFLQELQKTKMRRLKIRQLLLLVLRTLLILALVLAFSRPALHGSIAGHVGGRATSTMVILLDDSPSMTIRDEQGLLFDRAKHAASKIVTLSKQGDQIYLLRLSQIRHSKEFNPVQNNAATLAALDQMTPSQETLNYHRAFRPLRKLLAEATTVNKEVYLITDAQSTQFLPEKAAADTEAAFDPSSRIFLIDVQSRQLGNAGVGMVLSKTQIITLNKQVEMQAQVYNKSTAPLHNSNLSVYLDGSRVAQQSLDIPPQGVATPRFTVIPKRRGLLEGYVQLEDDALEIDNRSFFVLDVPQNINILLVGASLSDVRLPFYALTLAGDTSVAGLFSVRQAAEAQLSSVDLNSFDVVVSCNVKDFSSIEADRLAQFVHAGGGLVIFPGKESDIANYNTLLFSRLSIPPVTKSSPVPDSADRARGTGSYLSFDKLDLAHPLFSGLFEQPAGKKNSQTVESPKVYTSITVNAAQHGRTIISLSNGSGFLVEYGAGNGRVLLFAVEAGLTWSDFPLKGLFAPLLHRTMVYLTAQSQPTSSFVAGDPLQCTVRLKRFGDQDAFVFTSPSGVDDRILPHFLPSSGMATFESKSSGETGIYRLRRLTTQKEQTRRINNDALRLIPVNADTAESNLQRVSPEALRTFWKTFGIDQGRVRELTPGETIEKAIDESRFGVELWKYFLGLAVLFALAEMAVGREPQRPGPRNPAMGD